MNQTTKGQDKGRRQQPREVKQVNKSKCVAHNSLNNDSENKQSKGVPSLSQIIV